MRKTSRNAEDKKQGEHSPVINVQHAPITFRLPKVGEVDPYFSANRSFWNERILPSRINDFRPPILSFADKKPGARTGIRFIFFQSALAYFNELAAKGKAA